MGATKGKKLFDGALLTVKYFFDVIDASLWKSLLYRGLDFEEDVLEHPRLDVVDASNPAVGNGNALAEARASEPFAGDEAVENLALVQLGGLEAVNPSSPDLASAWMLAARS